MEYEIIDTKLALKSKPYFLIQICNYSEHVARIQGTMPEFGYTVLGNGDEQRYRLEEYSAYYRHLKQRFLDAAASSAGGYPHKCSHCAICKWSQVCQVQRNEDDHLSLVARMRRDQIGKLNSCNIHTVVDLAAARDDGRPERMNPQTFATLRLQATMQVRGRTEGPVYELLEHRPFEGFGLMPEPDDGDVFFDMEGDPLYEPGRGLEYLFGLYCLGAAGDSQEYAAFWGLDRGEEKARSNASSTSSRSAAGVIRTCTSTTTRIMRNPRCAVSRRHTVHAKRTLTICSAVRCWSTFTPWFGRRS